MCLFILPIQADGWADLYSKIYEISYICVHKAIAFTDTLELKNEPYVVTLLINKKKKTWMFWKTSQVYKYLSLHGSRR